MRSSLRLLSVIILSLAALAAVGVQPAAAFKTKTVTIAAGAKTVEKLGPIAGNYSGGSAAIPTPSGCGNDDNTATFEGTCDRVPIKIVKPANLGATDDFLVTITVTWDPKDDVKGNPVNDLDVYFWDNQQIGKRTNPTSTSFTRLATSATGAQPEKIKLFSPDLGDYNLTVVNFAGPNLSYTVTAELRVEAFDSPFEDLGPSFAGRKSSTSNASEDQKFVAPVDLSGGDPPPGPGPGRSAGAVAPVASPAIADVGAILSGGRPSLDEVPILPDADFSNSAGATSDALAAPPVIAGIGRTRLASAGPVSGVLLVFWLVLLPLALLAGGVGWLIRRNRSAFAFG